MGGLQSNDVGQDEPLECPPIVTLGGVELQVAFAGNSFTFYNDLPHLVQHILLQHGTGGAWAVHVRACLRGGAGLVSLCIDGADMHLQKTRFQGGGGMAPTLQELLAVDGGPDVLVLQDHSQAPARERRLRQTLATLHDKYFPWLLACNKRPLIVLFETWGFLRNVNRSEEIGDFSAMTQRLSEGYAQIAAHAQAAGLKVVVAPVGRAFKLVHVRAPVLWPRLYQPDAYHPSPLGSFLAAAHISAAIARDPELAPKFPNGIHPGPSWPSGFSPPRNGKLPSVADLATVLDVAGPSQITLP